MSLLPLSVLPNALRFQVQQEVTSVFNFEDVNVEWNFELIYGRLVGRNCHGNKSCLTQKRGIKVI